MRDDDEERPEPNTFPEWMHVLRAANYDPYSIQNETQRRAVLLAMKMRGIRPGPGPEIR